MVGEGPNEPQNAVSNGSWISNNEMVIAKVSDTCNGM